MLEDNVMSINLKSDPETTFQPKGKSLVQRNDRKVSSAMPKFDLELREALSAEATFSYRAVIQEFYSYLPSAITNRNYGTIAIWPQTGALTTVKLCSRGRKRGAWTPIFGTMKTSAVSRNQGWLASIVLDGVLVSL